MPCRPQSPLTAKPDSAQVRKAELDRRVEELLQELARHDDLLALALQQRRARKTHRRG